MVLKRMTTAHPLTTSETVPPHEPAASPAASASEQALMPISSEKPEDGLMALNGPVARLPVELDVALPVREFRVRNLLALEPGQVIATDWVLGEDMPLASGEVQLAWSEFEVIDAHLAVRVTRLV
jgi:flagellar motor switch/type III secretory pathway protein FliN